MEAKGIFHLFEGDYVRSFKRILSVFLSCILLLGLLPAVSFAEENNSYAGGAGTEADPYQISDANQLAALASAVNGGETYEGKYIKLTADINLSSVCGTDINGSEVSWTPIGYSDSTRFNGTFDGGGHTVSELYINGGERAGLFGCLGEGGTIKNLNVGGSICNGGYSGGICAKSETKTYIDNCCSSVNVNGQGTITGGVCGQNSGTITNSYSTHTVTSSNDGGHIGGVCGENLGTVTDSYSTCTVTFSCSTGFVGGVCGRNAGTVNKCYNVGNVTSTSSNSCIGGICGANHDGTIENCYNTGTITGGQYKGGVCGSTDANKVTNCFYLNTCSAEGAGTSKTAEEFAQQSTFDCWDFTDNWTMDTLFGRPILKANPEIHLIPDLNTLEKVRDHVNNGNNCEGMYFLLTADIDMSGTYSESANKSWTPIGNESNRFKGTFDGGGHTISGLYIYAASNDCQGLFGSLDSDGTIKNLGVVDDSVSGGSPVGGVCGMNRGTITNCYNTGSISGNNNHVGGICGYNNSYASITNCYNKGSVTSSLTSSSSVGGVCGINANRDANAIENCFYLDTCGAAGDGTSKTEAQFASGEVTWLLQSNQTEQIWGQTAGSNYPELTNDATKAIYKVTFDSNNGSTVSDQFVNSGGKVTEPPNPTKEGCTFGSWSVASYKDWNFTNDIVTEDITLVANWNYSGSGGSSTGGSTGDGTSSGGTGDDDSSTGNNPSDDDPDTDTPSGDEPIVEPDEPSKPIDEPSGEPAEPGDNPSDEPSEPAIEAQVIYRLYNRNSGEHFYTASKYERDSVEDAGWAYEGEAWTAPVKSNTPVYRLYSGTDHHYTKDANEKAWLEAQGWTCEGISWYSDDAEGVELYRLFNPNVNPSAPTNNSGSHHYTTSKAENDWLVSIGWQAEGVAWFGMK